MKRKIENKRNLFLKKIEFRSSNQVNIGNKYTFSATQNLISFDEHERFSETWYRPLKIYSMRIEFSGPHYMHRHNKIHCNFYQCWYTVLNPKTAKSEQYLGTI